MTRGHVLVIGLLVLGGCGDDDDDQVVQDLAIAAAADLTGAAPADMTGAAPADMTAGGDATTGSATRGATLTGADEVPPVNTVYTGTSTVVVNEARTEIAVTVTHTIPVGTTTAAHIHIGPPGVSGPIIFPLAAGAVATPLNMTLTAANLTPQAGAMTFAEAVNAILAGQTYVNVHSMTWPNGEIRGQLVEPQ